MSSASAHKNNTNTSQHMLAVPVAGSVTKAHDSASSANLLPCEIKHTGQVAISERHWSPAQEEDGSQTVYFRGRRLRGRRFSIPQGYVCRAVRKTGCVQQDTTLVEEMKRELVEDQASSEDDHHLQQAEIDELEAQGDSTMDMEGLSVEREVANIIIWDHEHLPDSTDEGAQRAMAEWMNFASAIHSTAG